jgi:hypothetical protein
MIFLTEAEAKNGEKEPPLFFIDKDLTSHNLITPMMREESRMAASRGHIKYVAHALA